MVPQLYLTVYNEQFASPGRAKRAQLRPTSAHRRNNPQPRPDFLFPNTLQPSYKLTRKQPHPMPPVDTGRPLFPPVRHLSFHSPVPTCPDNYLKTSETGKPQHMPPVRQATEPTLRSADRLQKLQLTEPPVGTSNQRQTALKNPQGRMDYPRKVHALSAQQLSACHSCFHVVKPLRAGHYIIHPEFVSECLR
ncbi:uncharacterized protein LOC115044085 isoform X2 [Echeneis naucrates]|uniref:uncharacterized protein LOC115044085 isoform X2 n=1 Tax=Echeneis naucrates TaxID=173247 RepID=UPI001114556E|nr:uncharacterized protein LOC115044085 isoform X2 [Echeneis naucrates]